MLQAEALGLAVPSASATRTVRVKVEKGIPGSGALADAVKEYLAEVAFRIRPKTLNSYTQALTLFLESCKKRTVADITNADVLAYQVLLRGKGNGNRTTANRVCTLRAFMRWAGRPEIVTRHEIPKYTGKVVCAYSRTQVTALLAAAAPEQRLQWKFFVESGGREQEVMYATWRDIDFDDGVFQICEKPDLAFRIRDGEERSVPLPDDLLSALKQRREARPQDRFLFPTRSGKPDGHLLRHLKSTALWNGLNCGHCLTKKGISCTSHPTCKTWELHRLRKTFATLHHESGVSVRTLMRWLGHSDLSTTLKYLEACDAKSDKARALVNRTFDGL